MISIKVPPLGESIVEATVSRWLKKKGDAVKSGDTIVELETDKITVEVPAPRAGVITSISANEGDVVKVDQLLGELDETAAAATAAATAPSPAPPAAAAPEPKSSPAARRVAEDAGISISDVAGTGRGGVVSKPDVIEHAAKAPPAPAPAASSAAAPSPAPARAPSG